MWILFNTAKPDFKFGLLEGKEYKVGRFNSHVGIGGDISISRSHALISVTPGQGPRPKVVVRDDNSSFGTYVGEAAIESSGQSSQDDRVRKGEGVEMRADTRVRFGLHSTIFKLIWQDPLEVCASTLNTKEKQSLTSDLQFMNLGSLRSTWSDDVTHLTVKEAILTVKVANALALGVPLVEPQFFKDFVLCLKSQQVLPDAKNYVPKLKESSFNSNEVNLGVDPLRRKLFKGKMFAFGNEEQMGKFGQAIEYAGGKSILVGRDKPDPQIFKLPANVLVEDSDNKTALWKTCTKVVAAANFVQIPDQNIGKAIMTCKVEAFCDPSKPHKVLKTQNSFDSKEVLAPETQILSARRPKGYPVTSTQKEEVPETPVSTNRNSKVDHEESMETMATLTIPSKTDREYNFIKPTPSRICSESKVETEVVEETPSPKKRPSKKKEASFECGHDSDDDLFNFEEDKSPVKTSSKRPRDEPEMPASKKLKGESPLMSFKRPLEAEKGEGSAMKRRKTLPKTPQLSKSPAGCAPKVINTTGFISKLSSSTIVEPKKEFKLEEVSLADLTKSYGCLRVQPLVVAPRGKPLPSMGRNNYKQGFVNAKTFKKQPLSCSSESRINTTIQVRVSNGELLDAEGADRGINNFFQPPEPAPRTTQGEDEDGLWGFTSSQQF